MPLDPLEFQHLCRLSRLAPSDETARLYAAECEDILSSMDKLGELDTRAVEPLYSPVRHETPFREDRAERRLSREDILANAPLTDGEYFIVPRIVEGK